MSVTVIGSPSQPFNAVFDAADDVEVIAYTGEQARFHDFTAIKGKRAISVCSSRMANDEVSLLIASIQDDGSLSSATYKGTHKETIATIEATLTAAFDLVPSAQLVTVKYFDKPHGESLDDAGYAAVTLDDSVKGRVTNYMHSEACGQDFLIEAGKVAIIGFSVRDLPSMSAHLVCHCSPADVLEAVTVQGSIEEVSLKVTMHINEWLNK